MIFQVLPVYLKRVFNISFCCKVWDCSLSGFLIIISWKRKSVGSDIASLIPSVSRAKAITLCFLASSLVQYENTFGIAIFDSEMNGNFISPAIKKPNLSSVMTSFSIAASCNEIRAFFVKITKSSRVFDQCPLEKNSFYLFIGQEHNIFILTYITSESNVEILKRTLFLQPNVGYCHLRYENMAS